MAAIGFNPFSPAVLAQPYPYYKVLREQAPVYFDAPRNQWILSRYQDIEAALRQPKSYLSEINASFDEGILNGADAAEHARVRLSLGRCFTRQHIAGLEDFIQTTVERLLAQAEARGTFDFVEDFAVWVPVAVLAQLLGVEEPYWPSVRRWSKAVMEEGVSTLRAESKSDGGDFTDFFVTHLTQNFKTPGDNLMGALLWASDRKKRLHPKEILSIVRLLHVAAIETTTNLLGNAMLVLLKHPEVYAAVKAEAEYIPAFIEESLRYDSPVQSVARITAHDVKVDGIDIPARSKVILLLGSANRDPEVFNDPNTFQLKRSNQHLAFGKGVHTCPGFYLTRREAYIAIQAVLQRMDALRPAENLLDIPQMKWNDTGIIRGPQRLLLACEATSPEIL